MMEPELPDDEDASAYLSIADLMSGMVMFFALLFITALIQIQEFKEKSQQQRQDLTGTLVKQLETSKISVTVDRDTGDVTVKESILFDEDSADLKPNGKAFLRQFIPVYSGVIFSKEVFEQEITRVIIEGHTSANGTYEHNLDLSLRRALSVSNYIFSPEFSFPSKGKFSQKIIAAGRGKIDAKQERDDPSDRKVVFRFQFKGENFAEWYRQNHP